MKNFYKGVLLVLLASFGYGLMPNLTKIAYMYGISVSTLLFIRFLTAASIFFVYIWIKFKKISITRIDFLSLLLLGGVCYTLQSTFYFTAVRHISVSLAVLILYTYPMFVSAISFFLRSEKPTVWVISAMLLSFAGLMLIVGNIKGNISFFGSAMAVLAAFIYSIYVVYGNHVIKQLPSIMISAFVTLFAACGVLLTGVITRDINFHFDARTLLPVAGIILFSTVLTIFTFFKGLELLGPTKASVLSMTEPVFTILLSMLLFKESMGLLQILGGIVVLAGALMVILNPRRQTQTGN